MPYSKEHKHQSKTRILQSAEELFCRYGFEHVSITEVMNRAGMTHGAFYAHFESKEELFSLTMLDSFNHKWYARLAKGPFSIKHLTGLVADYLNLKTLNELKPPRPASILVNEINKDRPQIRHLYEEAYERMKALVNKRITALSRLNKLPFGADAAEIEDKGRAILAILVGAMAIARNISSKHEQILILRAAQRQIIAMLGLQEREFVLV